MLASYKPASPCTHHSICVRHRFMAVARARDVCKSWEDRCRSYKACMLHADGLLFQLPTAISTPSAGQWTGAPALSRIPESSRFLSQSPSNLGSSATRGPGRSLRRANTVHSRSIGGQRNSLQGQSDARSSAVSTAQLNKLFDSPRAAVPQSSGADATQEPAQPQIFAGNSGPAAPTSAPEQRNLLKVDVRTARFTLSDAMLSLTRKLQYYRGENCATHATSMQFKICFTHRRLQGPTESLGADRAPSTRAGAHGGQPSGHHALWHARGCVQQHGRGVVSAT